jgi:hypothetical protein
MAEMSIEWSQKVLLLEITENVIFALKNELSEFSLELGRSKRKKVDSISE